MPIVHQPRRPSLREVAASVLSASIAITSFAACNHPSSTEKPAPSAAMSTAAPKPDPRVGLRGGLYDAGEAAWNLRIVSKTPPSEKFKGITNSDLTFTGQYVIQGSYNGYQVWDITDASRPVLKTAYLCPASQSDVSVYKNLLFVSGEGLSGRLDCGTQGVKDTVSKDRLRGIRIFDITDINNPKNVGNVQTCRGSHTHSLLVDPSDTANVYVYISGSARVRSPTEMPGCVSAIPEKDTASALFRIEVIKVPLAHPEQAAIVSSPRIFNDLFAPARHGEAPQDIEAARKAAEAERAKGGFTATIMGEEMILPPFFTKPMLDSIATAHHGAPPPNKADSDALRDALPGMIAKMMQGAPTDAQGRKLGPTQCHDITLYPAIGRAGGACEGYGMLLDIRDPIRPIRLSAVSDSNFSYWHSATFNNDGTKVLFTDEWGGGGQPKCRATDKYEWGADAIFVIDGSNMQFKSYYKMPAPQTAQENCVAHNGSLIPIPGRDVMVQAWYQGGVSVFDFTDASHPREIAFFDRGPVDSTRMAMGGSWSSYWYNGYIVSSEIARGLDIFELLPSGFISQNEINAAKTVHLTYLNVQGQPKIVWPPSFALARSYLDQLERSNGLPSDKISAARKGLSQAETKEGPARRTALAQVANDLQSSATSATDAAKVQKAADAVKDLAGTVH
ncbi:MAG TPA: hypothetical protein VEI06_04215 [Gemmatimonadaceae bacterium]|nr:hypothetical protein [Gemmatimonadaceae bacterium]